MPANLHSDGVLIQSSAAYKLASQPTKTSTIGIVGGDGGGSLILLAWHSEPGATQVVVSSF